MKIKNIFLYSILSLVSFFAYSDLTYAVSCGRVDTDGGDYYYQCDGIRITRNSVSMFGDSITDYSYSQTEANWSFHDGVRNNTTTNRLVFNKGDGTKTNPYQIYSWADLNNIRNNLSKSFILMVNLDNSSAGYDTYASASANGGSGWAPLKPFTGSFDGNGHTISGLYMSGRNESNRGLFGGLEPGAEISNIGVINATIIQGGSNSDKNIGILVGENKGGKISKAYSSGSVSVNPNCSNIGGLVGFNRGKTYAATISDSYTTADVSGGSQTGGLVGNHYKDDKVPSITNSYAASNVSGRWNIGNLVGYNSQNSGVVSNSFYNNQKSLSCGDPCNKQYYGMGITDAQMKSFSTFSNAGWDIIRDQSYTNQKWSINDGVDYPRLRYPYIVSGYPIIDMFYAEKLPQDSQTSIVYSSTNSNSCSASWLPGNLTSGNIKTAIITDQYLISCSNSIGVSYSTTTLKIIEPPSVSITSRLSSVNEGGQTTIDWSSTNSDYCNTIGGWGKNADLINQSGSTTTIPLYITTDFVVSCTGRGGTTYATSTVSVENSCGGSHPITSGLIGYWPFDEASGSVAKDYSGMGNDGDILNGVSVGQSGRVGRAYDFDGVDDKVSLGFFDKYLVGKDSLSVSMWVKLDTYAYSLSSFKNFFTGETTYSYYPSNRILMSNSVAWTNQRLDAQTIFAVTYKPSPTSWSAPSNSSDSLISFCVVTEGSGSCPVANQPSVIGRWYLITFVYDNLSARLYIDGNLRSATTLNGLTKRNVYNFPSDHPQSKLLIGSPPYSGFGGGFLSWGNYSWDGMIDEVAIWDRALSSEDVKNLYNFGSGISLINSCPNDKEWVYVGRNIIQSCTKTIPDTMNCDCGDGDYTCGYSEGLCYDDWPDSNICGPGLCGDGTPDSNICGSGTDYCGDSTDVYCEDQSYEDCINDCDTNGDCVTGTCYGYQGLYCVDVIVPGSSDCGVGPGLCGDGVPDSNNCGPGLCYDGWPDSNICGPGTDYCGGTLGCECFDGYTVYTPGWTEYIGICDDINKPAVILYTPKEVSPTENFIISYNTVNFEPGDTCEITGGYGWEGTVSTSPVVEKNVGPIQKDSTFSILCRRTSDNKTAFDSKIVKIAVQDIYTEKDGVSCEASQTNSNDKIYVNKNTTWTLNTPVGLSLSGYSFSTDWLGDGVSKSNDTNPINKIYTTVGLKKISATTTATKSGSPTFRFICSTSTNVILGNDIIQEI
jgi:hypothetical protein